MQLAVIQHSLWDEPGHYLREVAREKGITLCLVKAWRGEFPDPHTVSGFILLGGNAGISEEGGVSFFAKGKRVFEELSSQDR